MKPLQSLMYFPGVAMMLLLLGSCRSSRTDRSTDSSQTALWQQRPLTVDGLDNDWVKPLPYKAGAENLNYAVSNDGTNIYIMVSTKSPQEQQKIVEGGMTVWINGKAEKTYTDAIGISFPTDRRNDHDRNIMAAARPDLYKDKVTSLDDLKDYSLYGFSKDGSIESYDYGETSKEGVMVQMNFNNSGELVYEASVPLSSIFSERGEHAYVGKSVTVGLTLEGLAPGTATRQDGGGGGGGGVSVGGGLGFGSFGSGGGLGLSIGTGSLAHIGGKKNQPYKRTEIWQEISLARPR